MDTENSKRPDQEKINAKPYCEEEKLPKKEILPKGYN